MLPKFPDSGKQYNSWNPYQSKLCINKFAWNLKQMIGGDENSTKRMALLFGDNFKFVPRPFTASLSNCRKLWTPVRAPCQCKRLLINSIILIRSSISFFQEGYTNADPSQFTPFLCIIKRQKEVSLLMNCCCMGCSDMQYIQTYVLYLFLLRTFRVRNGKKFVYLSTWSSKI
jgi:hypothetical protein